MYEKILVAIDESDVAERVIAAAQELASLSQGEVWVLHARERETSKFLGSSIESGADARAIVNTAVAKLAGAGINAHGIVVATLYGHAADEIIENARQHDAGVIVMGSRGHGDLAGLLVGSTAHKVIHLGHLPILVVR